MFVACMISLGNKQTPPAPFFFIVRWVFFCVFFYFFPGIQQYLRRPLFVSTRLLSQAAPPPRSFHTRARNTLAVSCCLAIPRGEMLPPAV